ncbi:hypothetical protein Q8F55_006012 [Vanrija albida]|uniref:Phenazine biosynthesis protein n=1 Tax=Vanrija albida TaxID=181172 RepID=A0ABR3Q3J3_9TREE
MSTRVEVDHAVDPLVFVIAHYTTTMPLPRLQYQVVNAFAPTPHAGNQASVVLLPAGDPRARDDGYLQAVAADFNLAETAYLEPLSPTASVPTYALRWFTPVEEVPLCGHATLAAAHVLFTLHPQADELAFETRWRGTLRAHREGEGVRLDLPVAEVTPHPDASVGAVVAAALGFAEEDILRVGVYDYGGDTPVVQLRPGVDLASLVLDKSRLGDKVPVILVVTQLAESGETLRANARVFDPYLADPEDPVTGSAWATLTGYYLAGMGSADAAAALGVAADALGAAEIDARQLSRRGGGMLCRLVEGRAHLVGRGWRTHVGELEVL